MAGLATFLKEVHKHLCPTFILGNTDSNDLLQPQRFQYPQSRDHITEPSLRCVNLQHRTSWHRVAYPSEVPWFPAPLPSFPCSEGSVSSSPLSFTNRQSAQHFEGERKSSFLPTIAVNLHLSYEIGAHICALSSTGKTASFP